MAQYLSQRNLTTTVTTSSFFSSFSADFIQIDDDASPPGSEPKFFPLIRPEGTASRVKLHCHLSPRRHCYSLLSLSSSLSLSSPLLLLLLSKFELNISNMIFPYRNFCSTGRPDIVCRNLDEFSARVHYTISYVGSKGSKNDLYEASKHSFGIKQD